MKNPFKNLLLIVIVLFSVNIAKADAWDNLTEKQAKTVVKFLSKNPYIFDFCDCCGNSASVYLLKVKSTEITKCDWDDKQFSVKAKAQRISQMQWAGNGLDNYHTSEINEEVDFTVTMNYTFGYDKGMRWAVPLFKLIDYKPNAHVCVGATVYPDPSGQSVKVSDSEYKTWYASKVKE
ncbi:hypothetical protein K6119_18445 [Paracrocinitomix mangrovi]|uniref:hypothetical protein n=1 Tax=Paracrocinitomix mangrovi TaxID=2862509 RepID=UPI001C8D1FC9|nr:hypothetical protein [Paracrocinitomix mangrovi]UKN01707.1 hypothetical protein K6119_18445 [Paracrocinitomix mangrovi]